MDIINDLLARIDPEAADRYLAKYPGYRLELREDEGAAEEDVERSMSSFKVNAVTTSARVAPEDQHHSPAPQDTAANPKKLNRRQKKRAKKKATRERAVVANASVPSLAGAVAAPSTCDVALADADAAAPDQSRRASTDRDPTPPASPAPSYAEVLQRPSSGMSCASVASEHSISDDSDSDDGFQTVDRRTKRRRRASPQATTNASKLSLNCQTSGRLSYTVDYLLKLPSIYLLTPVHRSCEELSDLHLVLYSQLDEAEERLSSKLTLGRTC
ncbi:hypothetical protein ILUMI_19302 [Ignelater luminosus]|uniref:Uncharacterized protein n=1 Tax=Ignelater luminosus TaxID=2038154 RepID=A0A8K0CKT1_IGNLU|nr:hypothetical protein ILUMI_19302 [Ignelater luminosus]